MKGFNNPDQRTKGFTKKVDTKASVGTNYGWRGKKDSFQLKAEGGQVIKRQNPNLTGAESESVSQSVFIHERVTERETSSIEATPLNHNLMDESIARAKSQPATQLGHIKINAADMDKVSINSTYNGKAQINSINVMSNSARLDLKNRFNFDSSEYTARIKVNTRGRDNLHIRFNDEVGLTESRVTQKNLDSVGEKLGEQNIDIGHLSTDELRSLSQTGTIKGRRISLSSDERQTLSAYAKSAENPKSMSTLKINTDGIGGFRKKEASPELGRIKFSEHNMTPKITDGRIRVVNGAETLPKEDMFSRVKFISDPTQRRSQLEESGKVKLTNKSNGVLLRSADNVAVSEKTLVNNFSKGNIVLSPVKSKIKITDGKGFLGGGAGKVAGDIPVANIPDQTSVFSKYANALNFSAQKFGGLANGITGGIAKMGNVIGSIGNITSSPVAIFMAAILGVTTIFGAFGIGIGGTVLPTNNVEDTEHGMFGGVGAPNSNLQTILDELDYLQRAYEYNLIYADTVTKDTKTGKLYIKDGIPESWHEKIKALETTLPDRVPSTYENGSGSAAVVNINESHEDAGAMVTNVRYFGELKGHRLKHFWGPVTCLYPAIPKLETDHTTPDGHLDNRITVWTWEEVYHESTDSYEWELVPHEERQQLYCVAGLYGDAGVYTNHNTSKALHIPHSTEAYTRLKKQEPGYSTENAGNKNKINKNITVEYRYEGSKYSYLFTDEKEDYYYTSDKRKVTYDTYEFYRSLVSCASGFVSNGRENYNFIHDYTLELFNRAMDNATISIEPGFDGDAWFKANESGKRLEWEYHDEEGEKYNKPGKNSFYSNGVSKCSCPSYDCKAKIVITLHDTGVQDLMKLDDSDDGEAHASTFLEMIVDAIKNIIAKIRGTDKGSIRQYLIKNPDATHYNKWNNWEKDDVDEREMEVSEFFSAEEIERNTSQMTHAVMLTDLTKADFNDIFEGIKLPTSSILQDFVEDDTEIEEIEDGTISGNIPRPDIEDGVYLNNLCYINQGQGELAHQVRYIDDEGGEHTVQMSGCLDCSIMMMYLHYYHNNAENTTAGEILNMWLNFFKPYVANGSGMLNTSNVIASLGLTAGGRNNVTQCGWNGLVDSLYLGNPVLLHIKGHWEYGGRVLHKSSGGHFLIAVGADKNGIYVYDPGNRNNQSQCIPYEAWNSSYGIDMSDTYYKIYHATGDTVSDLGTTVETDYSDMPEGVLNAVDGTNYYGGRKETYYNMPIYEEGILVNRAREALGDATLAYNESPEGYKKVGDYIILAANFEKYPIGSILDTSLGKGIVVDTGKFAATNPNQIDIAVTW